MQTFKQFLEVREVRDIPHNNIRGILEHINDPILCVRFALYCAEDCFQFIKEKRRPLAQQCIDLVRKWLKDPESVTINELRSAADAAATANRVNPIDAYAAAFSATYAVVSTADTIIWVNDEGSNIAEAVADYAAIAFANASGNQYNSLQWRRVYNQKIQEYTRKLKGITTIRSGHSTSIEPLKGYENNYVTIMAALDSLEEIGEIGKDHFVYQDGNDWVFDLGHDNILRADSREELARLINNDKYYLNALMRLYNANV